MSGSSFRLHEELAEGLRVAMAASLSHLKNGIIVCDGTCQPRERPMRLVHTGPRLLEACQML